MTASQSTVGAPPEAGSSTAEPSAAQGSGRARRWLLIGLGVLLGALAVAALLLGLRVREAQAVDDRREDALRYAGQMAVNLTSISVQDLDADIEQVLDGATGEFEEEFARTSDQLRQTVRTNEVVSEGQVLEDRTALVRADENTATALVVVDYTVRNATQPEPVRNSYGMRLELERQGDRWLTSLLEFAD